MLLSSLDAIFASPGIVPVRKNREPLDSTRIKGGAEWLAKPNLQLMPIKKRLEQWRPTSDTKFVSDYFSRSNAASELIAHLKPQLKNHNDESMLYSKGCMVSTSIRVVSYETLASMWVMKPMNSRHTVE